MKGQPIFRLAGALALASVLASILASSTVLAQDPGPAKPYGITGALTTAVAAPLSTGFSYQGQLQKAGMPVNDTCDMQFNLHDAASGGAQVGSTITATVPITDGVFTVGLDFGSGAFAGDRRWLEVEVQCPGDASFQSLGRQELTSVPYALYASLAGSAPWSGLTSIPAGFADNTDDNTTYTAGTGLGLSGGAFSVSTSYRMPQSCGNGQIAEWNGSAWACGDDNVGTGGGGWSLTGNAGTTPGTHFLGTTDDQALELHVNGARVLRLEPNATSPNLIGGSSSNTIGAGAMGVTIGGGGNVAAPNRVTDNFGTIAGGSGNLIGNDDSNPGDIGNATIGGGYLNQVTGPYATIGGGRENESSAGYATIGGGRENTASGQYAFLGGGNSNQASADYTTVDGGYLNQADADYATIGGGQQNVVTRTHSTVGGGYQNVVRDTYAVIGGGYRNEVNDSYATVGGGSLNNASGDYATIGGGQQNVASGSRSTVPGGSNNEAAGDYSFAAGQRAKANHQGAFVWSDYSGGIGVDFSSTAEDQFLVRASGGVVFTTTLEGALLRLEPHATSPNLIGGHSDNTVTAGAYGATIGGGGAASYHNRVTDDYGTVGGGRMNLVGNGTGTTSDASYATVGGGQGNQATYSGATVGGGMQNYATALFATVGGGSNNQATQDRATVSGGDQNQATAIYATIGGGQGNQASGQYATVPGGYYNVASGDYSFAAGRLAYATHQGAFVWADSTATLFGSQRDDQFRVLANGGARFDVNGSRWVEIYDDGSNVIDTSTGARLTTGGAWTDASDRNLKENFSLVDGQEVLARLAEVPITTWSYKAQDPSIRHMGPVAQDFYAAFELGEDDRHIAALDTSGVALAAVQELYRQNQALAAENAARRQYLDDLAARVTALEQPTGGTVGFALSGWWGLVSLAIVIVFAGWRWRRGGGR